MDHRINSFSLLVLLLQCFHLSYAYLKFLHIFKSLNSQKIRCLILIRSMNAKSSPAVINYCECSKCFSFHDANSYFCKFL